MEIPVGKIIKVGAYTAEKEFTNEKGEKVKYGNTRDLTTTTDDGDVCLVVVKCDQTQAFKVGNPLSIDLRRFDRMRGGIYRIKGYLGKNFPRGMV